MPGQWLREGDFLKNCDTIISYRNTNRENPIISEIEIKFVNNEHFVITLYSHSTHGDHKFKQACKTIFTEDELKEFVSPDDKPFIKIEIKTPAMGKKFIALLRYMNSTYQVNEFTTELIHDFNTIINSAINKESKHKSFQDQLRHRVSIYLNPARNLSLNYGVMMADSNKNENLEETLNLLRNGANPNERDEGGMTLSYILILNLSKHKKNKNQLMQKILIRALRLIIGYGADLFDPDNGLVYISAAFLAEQERLADILQDIFIAKTRIKKPLITHFNQYLENGILHSDIQFENKQSFRSELMSNDKLKKLKKYHQPLFNLFSEMYKDQDQKMIEEAFKSSFFGKPHEIILIDIIFSNFKMIGLIVSIVHKKKKLKALEGDQIYFQPEFRSNGLAPMLFFLTSLALAPDVENVFVWASTPAGFGVFKGHFIHPMYNLKPLSGLDPDEIAKIILNETDGEIAEPNNYGVRRAEPISVATPKGSGELLLPPTEYIFAKYFMGYTESPENVNRLKPPKYSTSTAILAPFTDAMFKLLEEEYNPMFQILEKESNLNFMKLVTTRARLVPKINKKLDAFNRNSFFKFIDTLPKYQSLFKQTEVKSHEKKPDNLLKMLRSKL